MVNLKKFKDKKAIAMIAVVFALLIFIPVYYCLYIPVRTGNTPIRVTIEKGQSLSSIAQLLKINGIIRSKFLFSAYVKLMGEEGILKAGRYNFSGRLDVPDIAFILSAGLSESEDIRLLVSEGFNVWEIDQRLTNLDLIKEGEFSSKYYGDEGYLFPDTYRINRKAEGESFSEELRQRMSDNFDKKTADLVKGLSLGDLKEVIIIASILEKEARKKGDMELVSGIIRKRLKLGMPLQVDASVIYGACLRKFVQAMNGPHLASVNSSGAHNCDVTLQGPATEIRIDGPYNTYTHLGLPPAPIANPGLQSIEAALNPKESPYLYYLSTRDGSQMIFSKTASEHVANRKKYLGI